LLGDATKAKKILKWEPEISIDVLIKKMLDNDINIVKKNNLKIYK